jgi:hypothetical protein
MHAADQQQPITPREIRQTHDADDDVHMASLAHGKKKKKKKHDYHLCVCLWKKKMLHNFSCNPIPKHPTAKSSVFRTKSSCCGGLSIFS